jgi:hypothetical protein
MCGAGWRNSVFDLKTVVGYNPSYIGCYKDENVRAMETLITPTFGNILACAVAA